MCRICFCSLAAPAVRAALQPVQHCRLGGPQPRWPRNLASPAASAACSAARVARAALQPGRPCSLDLGRKIVMFAQIVALLFIASSKCMVYIPIWTPVLGLRQRVTKRSGCSCRMPLPAERRDFC